MKTTLDPNIFFMLQSGYAADFILGLIVESLNGVAAFSSYLDVPEAHMKDHSALPLFAHVDVHKRSDVVRLHSGKVKPESAFSALRYREHWFWIDDADWQTKRALTAVMFLFTLAEGGAPDRLPLVTIPAQ